MPRPAGCPDVWDPVCGCDGVTYSNACDAAAAGMSVDYPGECVEVCRTNEDCNPEDYCLFEECAAQSGTCQPRPDACPDLWDPVCGCDGVSYSNRCEAARAGISVDYPGACVQACSSNDDCAANDYCYLEDCAAPTGVCQPRPGGCPEVWDPVCGCDGQTYSNACFAAAAGVSVDYPGECNTSCWGNDDCAANEYCFFHVCAAETGICLPRPDTCPDLWDPVCGCDGMTYANACEAARVGVSIDYAGPCRPTPCMDNTDCVAEHYCAKTIGDCGGVGECEPRPGGCPGVLDPVCGCDGNTYNNACEAAFAGVSIAYLGPCQ